VGACNHICVSDEFVCVCERDREHMHLCVNVGKWVHTRVCEKMSVYRCDRDFLFAIQRKKTISFWT
jgi:hypothetical protein